MARTSIVPIILGGAGLAAVAAALAAASSGTKNSEPNSKSTGRYTPEQAANALLLYLEHPASGDFWGSKDSPNKIIAAAQLDMLTLVSDGIYGPATKARGEALTGKPWPARAAAAAKKPAASIPSNKVQITESADRALTGDGQWKTSAVQPETADQMVQALTSTRSSAVMTPKAPRSSAVMTSTAPRSSAVMTPTPPPGATTLPAERSPKDAAQALYTYATQLKREGRADELGTKEQPSNFVAAAQRDMRKLQSDGIYGPKTQARGKELLAIEFPNRYGTGSKVAAPVPPLTAANQQQRAAQGLLAYLQGQGADQGSKGSPSPMVRAAQQQMGALTADGIYGPATRARGAQLINTPFPPRK
jgi:hypothetical protein